MTRLVLLTTLIICLLMVALNITVRLISVAAAGSGAGDDLVILVVNDGQDQTSLLVDVSRGAYFNVTQTREVFGGWSQDGSQTISYRSLLRSPTFIIANWDALTRQTYSISMLAAPRAVLGGVRFSPDGRSFLYILRLDVSRSTNLFRFNPQTEQSHPLLSSTYDNFTSIAWSEREETVLAAARLGNSTDIYRIPITDDDTPIDPRDAQIILHIPDFTVAGLQFSSDGTQISYVLLSSIANSNIPASTRLMVMDANGANSSVVTNLGLHCYGGSAAPPLDENPLSWVALVCLTPNNDGYTIQAINPISGETRGLAEGSRGVNPQWSGDGNSILFAGDDGLYRVNLNTASGENTSAQLVFSTPPGIQITGVFPRP